MSAPQVRASASCRRASANVGTSDGQGSTMTTRAEYDGPIALLARIFRETVDLAGALCTGRPELFDEDPTPERFGQALEVCQTCPVRAACWEWSSNARVAGVTASTVQRPRSWTDTSVEADSTGGRRIGTSPTAVRSRRHRATQRVNERHTDDGSIDQ
ncbi:MULTISPECIES: WhiB family transcriptional regulator [Actinomycetes]|uniref:WhiB family transcriptional regulator n=1 Tax=Actinomycetes TaxID=1760 RepID=UPI0009DE8543